LIAAGLALAAWASAAPASEGQLRWFTFHKSFISTHYPHDVAVGAMVALTWARAQQVHPISCGGKDGELHIGISQFGPNESPPSAPLEPGDAHWGIVAELPNAGQTNGPEKLDGLRGEPVSFRGYFRVWDEGHTVGATPKSNPHHVFEIHPAWGFSSGATNYERRRQLKPMPGYHGYGASKFGRLFTTLKAGEWLHVFQDENDLHVELREAANFFQLPVVVQSLEANEDGHTVMVDVFSDKEFQHLAYGGLRCITVSGSRIDGILHPGDQTFFLGFFSVNLKRCLDGSGEAHSEATGVAVPEALEFFVFGRPLETAVLSSNCDVDENDE
jgi:hypothetical protein